MAQLVARGVWDAEVASSSLVAPTIQGGKIKKIYFLYLTDAEWNGFREAKNILYLKQTTWWSFFYLFRITKANLPNVQVVNASSSLSSSLVAPTTVYIKTVFGHFDPVDLS